MSGKVLFLNPPWWTQTANGLLCGVRAGSRWPFQKPVRSTPNNPVFGDYTPYPFFLAYAATYAAKNTDFKVRFHDSIAYKDDYGTFIAYLERERPDFIVLEEWTSCWEHDKKLIKGIHDRFPKIKIIVTGPITIKKSKEILETLPVVACVQGEYEKGVVRVLKGERGVIPFDLLTTEEMNAAPFPYYDRWMAHLYCDENPTGHRYPHAHVWSSRGCRWRCQFCITPGSMTNNDPDGQGERKMRFYSADYLFAFLTDLKERFAFQSFYFDDDTMNMGNKHTNMVCDVMRKVGLPWSAMCRADTVSKETWKNMRDSGCYGVKIGIETGSQYVMDKIVRKGLDLKDVEETCWYIRSLGMSLHGTFTYGHPGETPEQRKMTRALRERLPLTSYQESGVAEMDGSPLAEMREKGALKGYEGVNFDDNYVRDADGVHKMTQEILKELHT